MQIESNKFPPGYIDNIFTLWYMAGKPRAATFYRSIPAWEFNNEKPSLLMLRGWMNHDVWLERTEQQDEEVRKILTEQQVLSKVEMFERHAEVGREMQGLSLAWLQTHKDDLTPGTAVRMLVDGITIEQGAAGIPDALRRMMNMNDEDLIKEIAQSIADTPNADYTTDT